LGPPRSFPAPPPPPPTPPPPPPPTTQTSGARVNLLTGPL
jgi:OmpA-OmpF porin, OOP family